MSNFDSELAVFHERLAEVKAELEGAECAFGPARKAVEETKTAARSARERFEDIATRVSRSQRPSDVTPPAIIAILEEARKARDEAAGDHSLAKARLANLEWKISCLRADIDGLERAINPPPAAGRLVEIVRREPPPEPTVELVTFGRVAGEAA